MNTGICGQETFSRQAAREAKKEKGRTAKRAIRSEKKRWDRHEEARRLLARMAPELELAKNKWESRPWFQKEHSPNGGVYYMGLAKAERQTDTRRVRENDFGFRGWRMIVIDGCSAFEIRKGRSLIGNRNGSAKTFGQPVPKKQLARNNFRQLAKRELQEELAAAEDLEMERSQEKLAREENWWHDCWLTESERRERKRELDISLSDPQLWIDSDEAWLENQRKACHQS